MRANIIIHSVTGNLLLIAKVFQEKLQEKGVDARIYRVEDPDLHLSAAESNEANEYYEDIISLPLASMEKLRKGDVTIMGCPAIFSLPTAEMKAFLDQTIPLLDSRDMENRLCFIHVWGGGRHFSRHRTSALGRQPGHGYPGLPTLCI